MILEMHPLLRDFPEFRQRKDLETTAIGKDRTVPTHELVKAAKVAHHVHARTDKEMVGVAEDNLRVEFPEFPRAYSLDGPLGSHRHENGRLHNAVRRCETAPAGFAGGIGG